MSNQEKQSQRKLSVAETIAQLVASGATLGQKTGAILMPVSKGYRASVEHTKVIVKDEPDSIITNDNTS